MFIKSIIAYAITKYGYIENYDRHKDRQTDIQTDRHTDRHDLPIKSPRRRLKRQSENLTNLSPGCF